MPPRMLERWLRPEDLRELEAYYYLQNYRRATEKAAEQTDTLASRRKRAGR